MMTDERMGDRLWEAVARLPDGAGIVFRHYSLPADLRGEMAARLAETAAERGITLAVAGDVRIARQVGATLIHNPTSVVADLPCSVAVHSLDEARARKAARPTLAFVSPVYVTGSHPDRAPLGPQCAGEIARAIGVPAIALGGMDARRFARLRRESFYGWAGIDVWLRT